MFKQRIISALLLICLFVGLPWLPHFWFSLVLAGIVLLAAWEWAQLVKRMTKLSKNYYVVIYLLTMAAMIWVVSQVDVLWVLGLGIGWWFFVFALILIYPRFAPSWSNRFISLSLAGCMVLLPSWKALVELQSVNFGAVFVLYFLLLIAMADSMAFFTGRKWGVKKLAPKLSPGKTWQGVYGALASSCLVSILGAWYFGFHHGYAIGFLLIGMITVIASIFGDLAESMIKREAGVKDSSHLIPGHGGIMDRIDSITAAAPVFVLLLGWIRANA